MSIGNPNHPVSRATENEWHKIAALLIYIGGGRRAFIHENDVRRFAETPGGLNITIRYLEHGIQLELVNDETADALARKEGGRAV